MKRVVFALLAFVFCFVSCNDGNNETSKRIVLNVISPSAERAAEAIYWQESDCTKYGVSVYKTDEGTLVDSGEFTKNGNISFTLLNEGTYTIEVTAYNADNFIIAGGSKDKTVNYGDIVNVVINVTPNQKGFKITLNDGIEIVWNQPGVEEKEEIEIIPDSSEKNHSVGEIIYDSNGKAVAIVTGQGVDGKWFALGLYRSEPMKWLNLSDDSEWSEENSGSDGTYYEEIGTHVNEDGSYTGDADGSDNWSIIYNTLETIEDDWRFQAFYWANHYDMNLAYNHEIDLDYSRFATSWYLPSLVEYYIMWKNRSIIDSVLDEISGDCLSGYKYWSSSQDSERTHYDAGDFDFNFDNSFDSDTSGWKTFEQNNCRAIIKLND